MAGEPGPDGCELAAALWQDEMERALKSTDGDLQAAARMVAARMALWSDEELNARIHAAAVRISAERRELRYDPEE